MSEAPTPATIARNRIENAILRRLIRTILDCGYAVRVDFSSDDDDIGKPTRAASVAFNEATMCEQCWIVIVESSGLTCGWVHLVFGNDGHDLITNYYDNELVRRLIRPAELLAESYERKAA